ncbi:MAG TPA: hypothetical protein DCQ06_10145 [Myxococcales bacterium]|nr:hypothetical protein [Myxococcales bacterium]
MVISIAFLCTTSSGVYARSKAGSQQTTQRRLCASSIAKAQEIRAKQSTRQTVSDDRRFDIVSIRPEALRLKSCPCAYNAHRVRTDGHIALSLPHLEEIQTWLH